MQPVETRFPPLTVAQALRNIAAEVIERKKKTAAVEKTTRQRPN
jgi:hypothetical protein